MIDHSYLKDLAALLGVFLDDRALERFDLYAQKMCDWNEKINLTAITDPREICVKHFADSLSVLAKVEIPQGAKLIDVGTGAGFPGLALKIARPDLRVTLLDSTKKKLTVLEDISQTLELEVELLHKRAEEAGQSGDYREKFDIATARAVANLAVLSEYCLPFVRVGGRFLAMKSAKTQEELTGAKKAIGLLGGKVQTIHTLHLETAGERTIIELKKTSPTPAPYPRPSAKIARFPLG